jgi:hypothetical protein
MLKEESCSMEFAQLTLISLSLNTFGTVNKIRARHPWNYIWIRDRGKRFSFSKPPDQIKAHAASNSMDTKLSFLGGKVACVNLPT